MSVSTPEVVQRATHRDLGIDIFWPEQDEKRTAVILLHGGGWAFGHRSATHAQARLLARHGYLAIAAEYRLLGEAPWPAQIIDVKDTVGWVRDNAEDLRIDPGKIALQGYSAGGHLALLAAGTQGKRIFMGESEPLTPGDIGAVISFFAPPGFTADIFPLRPPPVQMLLGPAGNEDVAAAASPLTYIGPGFPPTFLLNGTADPFMPFQLTLRLFDAISAAGARAALHLYHDHNHEFSALPSMLEPVQAEVALFLDRALVRPEFYQDEDRRLNIFSQPGGPFGPPR